MRYLVLILLITVCIFTDLSADIPSDRGLDIALRELTGDITVPGKQYVVLIAIDSYQRWHALKNPVRDAREIRAVLERRYYVDECIELYNMDATKEGIIKLFGSLVEITKPQDSVLIYYAGHGYLDPFSDTGFWIPVDGGVNAYAQYNWIPNNQIRGFIGKMKARHIALISDSCFAGDILDPTRGRLEQIDSEYFRNAYKRVSRQVLTSGASESVPDTSLFSQQLKLALEGNTRPYLDPLMLYNEIRLGVKGTTPLFGALKNSGHQDGASFLLFLRDSEAVSGSRADPVSARTPSGNAELMVHTNVEGAEVVVNGISCGISPVLIQNLPEGRPLVVEARTAYESGRIEVTLKSRELREVILKLERMKGNLYIESNERDVAVHLNGKELGPLGNGLFRNLDAGEYELELTGSDLRYRERVVVPGGETGLVRATVVAVGSVLIDAPPEVSVSLQGSMISRSAAGGGTITELPIGTYTVSASGPEYESVRRTVHVRRGEVTKCTPYTTGKLAVSVEPPMASWSIDEVEYLESEKNEVSLPPGDYTVRFRRAGYHEELRTVTVEAGKIRRVEAVLTRFLPGVVEIPEPPFGATIRLGRVSQEVRKPGEPLVFTGIPAGVPLTATVNVRMADSCMSSAVPSRVVLEEAGRQQIEIPTGRFSVPFLPEGSSLAVVPAHSSSSRFELPLQKKDLQLLSPPLAEGLYTVVLSGSYPYRKQVRVSRGTVTELPGYRDELFRRILTEQDQVQSCLAGKLSRIRNGWISFGAGIVGGAGAGASYIMGLKAMKDYREAPTTEKAVRARTIVELCSVLLTGAAFVGGTGAFLAPYLWLSGPDPDVLQNSLDTLDESLRRLAR